MLRERISLFRRLNVAVDLVITAASFFIAYYIRSEFASDRLANVFPITDYLWLLLVILPLWWLLFTMHGAYASQRTTPLLGLSWVVIRVVFWGGVFLFATLYAFKYFLVSRWLVGSFLVVNAVLLILEKTAIMVWLHFIRKKGYNFRTVLIVGIGDRLREIIQRIKQHSYWGMKVIGFVTVDSSQTNPTTNGIERLGNLRDLPDLLHRHVVDEVIFAVPIGHLDQIESSIRVCEEQGIKTQIAMHFYTPSIAKTYVEDMDGLPMLTYSTTPEDFGKLYFKRVFDVAVTLIGLIVLSPLLLLIALAIKLFSPGPVLFKQQRIGLNGREFMCYKFRTMVKDAEALKAQLEGLNEMTGPVFKMSNDPRVTKVGRALRKFSLDELPQLFNVLRGDLSLVGPRPPIIEEVQQYERWQRRRLSMRPGITGIWQVEGRNTIADFDAWVRLDLQYIDNWSLMLDFKILLKTIPSVLLGRGAH